MLTDQSARESLIDTNGASANRLAQRQRAERRRPMAVDGWHGIPSTLV